MVGGGGVQNVDRFLTSRMREYWKNKNQAGIVKKKWKKIEQKNVAKISLNKTE